MWNDINIYINTIFVTVLDQFVCGVHDAEPTGCPDCYEIINLHYST